MMTRIGLVLSFSLMISACGGSSNGSSMLNESDVDNLTTAGMKVSSQSLPRPDQGLSGLRPPSN